MATSVSPWLPADVRRQMLRTQYTSAIGRVGASQCLLELYTLAASSFLSVAYSTLAKSCHGPCIQLNCPSSNVAFVVV